jgi:hypothetical protein
MRVLRFLGWLSVVIVLVICAAIFAGSRLPEAHVASVTDTVPASQQKVWARITDPAAMPRWRTGLKAVSLLPAQNGAPCWAEVQSGMTMPLCADVREEPSKQVVRIADPKRDLDVCSGARGRECDQGDDYREWHDRAGSVAVCRPLHYA